MATGIVRAIDTFFYFPQAIVIFMSLGFIGFVTLLHIIGKVRWNILLHRCMHWSHARSLHTLHQCSISVIYGRPMFLHGRTPFWSAKYVAPTCIECDGASVRSHQPGCRSHHVCTGLADQGELMRHWHWKRGF